MFSILRSRKKKSSTIINLYEHTTFHAHVTKYNYNDKKNNDGNDCNGKR